ncbi:MAG: type II toxin-antitoxin system VapC family toxin [Rhizomicrobium sp.]
MILLDTCVVSESVKPKPAPAYLAWLKFQDPTSLFISVISLGELHCGAAKSKAVARKREHNVWIGDVERLFANRIVVLDDVIARQWGYLRAFYPQTQTVDAQLAATALAHGFTFATRHVRHFRFNGLAVVNPWEA